MPNEHDVRIWTAWGAPIANKDMAKWETAQVDEHKQDGWFYPKQLTDSQGCAWECTKSLGTNTLSYTPRGENIHSYHITFPKDSPESKFVLHETIKQGNMPNITYKSTKNLDTPIVQLENGKPTKKQQNLVESIFKYQQERYTNLFGKEYAKEYSPIKEEDGIFKNRFDGKINPRHNTELRSFLKDLVRKNATSNDEPPSKKQRTKNTPEPTAQTSIDPELLSQLADVEQKFILLGKDAKKDTYDYTLASKSMDESTVDQLIQQLREDNFIGVVTKNLQPDGSIILEAFTDKTAHKALKHGMSKK